MPATQAEKGEANILGRPGHNCLLKADAVPYRSYSSYRSCQSSKYLRLRHQFIRPVTVRRTRRPWKATGDRALIERYLPNAEACLTWIDKYGDSDGDGLQEHQTRSMAGENMAWKDSGDSVMYPDGSLVKGPKALCGLQGYVYDAWLRMAEIYDELDNKQPANRLRKKAARAVQPIQLVFLGREVRVLRLRPGRG